MQTEIITLENYEEFFMRASDNELDAVAHAALQEFLIRHPELQEEAACWQQMQLQPDLSIVFKGKEALLQPEKKALVLPWRRWSLAAAAAVLLAVFLLPRFGSHRDLRIAHHMPAIPAVPQVACPAITATNSHPKLAALSPSQTKPVMKSVVHPGTDTSRAYVRNKTPLLMPVADKYLESQTALVGLKKQVPAFPAVELPAAQEKERKSTSPSFKVAGANQVAFELLKEGLEARRNQVLALALSLRETTVVLRLGNEKMHVKL